MLGRQIASPNRGQLSPRRATANSQPIDINLNINISKEQGSAMVAPSPPKAVPTYRPIPQPLNSSVRAYNPLPLYPLVTSNQSIYSRTSARLVSPSRRLSPRAYLSRIPSPKRKQVQASPTVPAMVSPKKIGYYSGSALYVPCSIMDKEEDITCPICHKTYRITDVQTHVAAHRKEKPPNILAELDLPVTPMTPQTPKVSLRQSQSLFQQLFRISMDSNNKRKIRELFEAESIAFQPNPSIRYADSVAIRGSVDERPESFKLQANKPSILGPFHVAPSTIPFTKPTLEQIPSVISQKNSMVSSASPARFS